jgi:hypothetical protein
MKLNPLIAAALWVCASGLAFAQEADSPPAAGKAERGQRAEAFAQKFKQADKDGDGLLTREEAQAGMPRLARHFDRIDTAKSGRVSLDQVAQFARDQQRGK